MRDKFYIRLYTALCVAVIVFSTLTVVLNVYSICLSVKKSREIGKLYTVSAVAETRDDVVWFLDENGNEWLAWLDGSSEVAGEYTLVLWDNATPSDITDDVILEWR